jgi:carbon-monoxide dehydrogenase iron sulfur subunit
MAEHSDSKNYIGALFEKAPPQTRIFVEATGERAVPVVCRHCTEPMCVSACMAGCMQKDPATGVVTNLGHEQQCVGCWMCVMSCPFGVITAGPEGEAPRDGLFARAIKCDFCPDRGTPACVEACPDAAITVADTDVPASPAFAIEEKQ